MIRSLPAAARDRLMRVVSAFAVMAFILGMFTGLWGIGWSAAQPLTLLVGTPLVIMMTGFASLALTYAIFCGVLRLMGITMQEVEA